MARTKKDIDKELMYKKLLPTSMIADDPIGDAQPAESRPTATVIRAETTRQPEAAADTAPAPPPAAAPTAEPTPVIPPPAPAPAPIVGEQPAALQAALPASEPQPPAPAAGEQPAAVLQAALPAAEPQAPAVRKHEQPVNLMEDFVEARLDEAIKKFNCCNCEKCRKDIMALALNKLPPFYVIEDDVNLRDEKEKERAADVATALVQAILVVRNNPGH